MGCVGGLGCPSWFVTALGSWTHALAVSWSWYLLFSGPFLGFFCLASRLAAGLRWLGFLLNCPPSVASLWRVLTWFFVGCLLACPHGAAAPLDYWVRWCSYSSCWVTYLRSGRCSSSVPDRDVAFPPLVGLAFGISAVLLPRADAVGFGLCWSARLSDLLTGRCCSFTLDSSSLAWLEGEPSTVFLLLCLPSGCGHPLGSLVSSVTIDRQRRFPLEEFFFCAVASHLVVRS